VYTEKEARMAAGMRGNVDSGNRVQYTFFADLTKNNIDILIHVYICVCV